MNQNPPPSPLHIGWRTIKTAVAATLVAMVYCAVGRNPAFACIGVIFGIGSDMKDSIKNGGNRLFGTLIGGLLSIAVFRLYLIFFPHGDHTVWLALFLGLGIVALIQLCLSTGRVVCSRAAWCSASYCSARQWKAMSAMP